jgi:hypothetical protein
LYDEKTWKEHYDDWCNVIKRLQGTDQTVVFRRKIIQRLIDEYDHGHEISGVDAGND